MKFEHVFLGRKPETRGTYMIRPATKTKLDTVKMSADGEIIKLPGLPFELSMVATGRGGGTFDIMKGGQLVMANYCCFNQQSNSEIMSYVYQVAGTFNSVMFPLPIKKPVTSRWLYSMIIDPRAFDKQNIIIANEIAFYTFEKLFLAWQKEVDIISGVAN